MNKDKLVFWFEELGQKHNDIVGKKGASLGEMCKLGVPVTPGFAISLEACRGFMSETGTNERISEVMNRLGKISNIDQCEQASRKIRSLIENTEVPDYINEAISSYFDGLGERVGMDDFPFSVRSSGPTSRPGMFDTYLNISGKENMIQHVKKVWSSAFTRRAIWYRLVHNIGIDADIIGVVVQKLVSARSAGVIFTADPITGDESRIFVNASWGMGEGVVGDKTTIDRFILDKETLEILESSIGDKRVRIICNEQGVKSEEVPVDMRSIACVNEHELRMIAEISINLEKNLNGPQDIEWAIDPDLPSSDNIFFLQTRLIKFNIEKTQSAVDRLVDILAKRSIRPH